MLAAQEADVAKKAIEEAMNKLKTAEKLATDAREEADKVEFTIFRFNDNVQSRQSGKQKRQNVIPAKMKVGSPSAGTINTMILLAHKKLANDAERTSQEAQKKVSNGTSKIRESLKLSFKAKELEEAVLTEKVGFYFRVYCLAQPQYNLLGKIGSIEDDSRQRRDRSRTHGRQPYVTQTRRVSSA